MSKTTKTANLPVRLYVRNIARESEFTIKGQTEASKTDKKTVTSTRMHDQGDASLCWDYAAASSIRKSLRVKISEFIYKMTF